MSGSNPYSYQQTTASNALYNVPTTVQRPQSSLLLNSVNLAWSQPNECILVAPKPEIASQQLAMSSTVGDFSDGQAEQQTALAPDSPTSSVNTSEYGKISSVSSDFDRLSIADSTKTSTSNLDSVSHQAVAGSVESLSVMSSDSGSVVSSPSDVPADQQPPPQQQLAYKEVDYHWFYQKDPTQADVWQPFSNYDNYNLEYSFRSGWHDNPIPTNGTRFDVLLRDRTRKPAYWQGPAQKVQRCSWFFKRDSDYRFVPYTEEVADILESTYRDCFTNNVWNRRVDLASHEFVIFYAADSVYHYISETSNEDGWGAMMETHMTPRYAYRGVYLTEAQKERDEVGAVEHVIFMVHGIGDFCDISFRKLVDVVDDFREISSDLLTSHYSHLEGQQSVGRVEVLPISWHSALHTDTLDAHLKQLTLPSIPRIRSFTNDTIMDALFYTAPQHSQTIRLAVAAELNRLYSLFLGRNPGFTGTIALGGHSLGSLILFDLLSHQATSQEDSSLTTFPQEQLYFRPAAFFAFGSPIPVFLSVRGIHRLDLNFQLPTCPSFYNVFHPYDPIAYRMEPLINVEAAKLKPVLVPHHKGRKRFHLEIRDSLTRMGTELKDKVLTSIKGTLDSVYGFLKAHQRTDPTEEGADGQQQQLTSAEGSGTSTQEESGSAIENQQQITTSPSCTDILSPSNNNTDLSEAEQALVAQINFGRLNSGRRIDYVLQERPIEIVNEYLFAIAAHGCYWISEDTALLVLRELYGSRGIVPCFQEQAVQLSASTASAAQTGSVVPSPPGPPPPAQTYSELIQQTTLASPTAPTYSVGVDPEGTSTYVSPPSFTTLAPGQQL